jgi:hypothetical protein
MLLRQKAIVEGALALLGDRVAVRRPRGSTAEDAHVRARSKALLDLLTPIAKTFPAEQGFESQRARGADPRRLRLHERVPARGVAPRPEAQHHPRGHHWHPGASTSSAARRSPSGGATLALFHDEVRADLETAERAGVDGAARVALASALETILALTAALGQRGASGDVEGMMAHSADYLECVSIVVVAWQHLRLWSAARRLADDAFRRGLVQSARYWFATELPRVRALSELAGGEDRSFRDVQPDEL